MKRTKKRSGTGQGTPTAATLARDLHELAANYWWSWETDARELWDAVRRVLPDRYQREHAPVLSRSLRSTHLEKLLADPVFCRLHSKVLSAFRRMLSTKARSQSGVAVDHPVAYFSMEFAVHESLPIYAGGLGVLAGDHAKSASDERVPFVGVGLYYRRGYFRQELSGRGKQRVVRKLADVSRLAMEPVKRRGGKELRIHVQLPHGEVALRAWIVRVGRVNLYLLDAELPENSKQDRELCQRLYSSPREERIRQEVLLGIGGVRLLEALGIVPSVWHLNEGHVAFLALERIRRARSKTKLSVKEAIEYVASDTLFTTHTPVPEGNEVFDLALAREHLEPHAAAAGVPVDDILSLGLDRTSDGREVLSMTVLALRFSRFRNGVSALHGEVSRGMWRGLWPGLSRDEVPIGSVTNGVHMKTWVAPEMDRLLQRFVGADWDRHLDDADYWSKVAGIPEVELWETKLELKRRLVEFVRRRESERLVRERVGKARREREVSRLLNPESFTIGFARRFALYKRADLIFHDLERAARLFGSSSRPVQLLFAGKPHPDDPAGRKLFERVATMSKRSEFRGRVVVLENYDMEVGRLLVQGVDVWLNNPRRPLEASGTSGQKVPLNGGLNCSILDGWWCEGYTRETGWAFGQTRDYTDLRLQDREDAAALYEVLEKEVVPLYYKRDLGGRPRTWLRRVKSAIQRTAPLFSSSHMVLEYVRRYYGPAARHGAKVRARGGHRARELAAWRSSVEKYWPLVHVRDARRARGGALSIELFLGAIPPRLACLGRDGGVIPLELVESAGGGVHRFELPREPVGVVRVFATHPALASPQEIGLAVEVTAPRPPRRPRAR